MRKDETPTILITGATGNIGKELTKQLAEKQVPFRAMVHSKQGGGALAELAGAELVIADFNDEKAVANAFKALSALFF